MNQPDLIGGVEAGGTTFRCGVGASPLDLRASTTINTTTPEETLAAVINFFRSQDDISSLGIASFGPVNLDSHSPHYGEIQDTPKPGWQATPLLRTLAQALDVPVSIHTDVVAAAMAEHRYGAARGLRNVVYVTVGTGIGAGLLIDGEPAPCLIHSEMGHILIPRLSADTDFDGICPYHDHCIEGFASAPAIRARWGRAPHELPPAHEAWRLQATYLGTFCCNLIRTIAPERILLGGGVMQASGLIEEVQLRFAEAMAGYHSVSEQVIKEIIVKPELGTEAGLTGAMLLAER